MRGLGGESRLGELAFSSDQNSCAVLCIFLKNSRATRYINFGLLSGLKESGEIHYLVFIEIMKQLSPQLVFL